MKCFLRTWNSVMIKKYITITMHKIILTNFDQHKSKLYSYKYKTSQQLTMKTISGYNIDFIFPVGSNVSHLLKIQLKFGFLMSYANL